MLELRCDMKVVSNMSKEERIYYLETILHVMKQTSIPKMKTPVNIATFVKSETDNFIHQRFEFIFISDDTKNTKVKFLCLIIPFFILSYFVILQPAYFPPENELHGQDEINIDNSYIIYESGTMELYVDDQFYSIVTPNDIKMQPYSDLKQIQKGDSK